MYCTNYASFSFPRPHLPGIKLMLLLLLGPRQKAAVKRLINCPVPVVSANCRLALSSRLQKYRLFTRKEFVSFLVGDRNENESSGKEGTTRSSRNDVELSPVKRSNYSTLPLVSLKCPLPRLLFSIHRPVTCHTRTQVEGAHFSSTSHASGW